MRLSDVAEVLGIIVAIITIFTFLAGLWSLPGQEPTPPEPVPPEPEHSITVRVNTYPRTILAGESTEISVMALSGNVPVPGANVKISAGGGFFEDTGHLIVTGITNDQGVFRTIWHTCEKSAYTGEMGYLFSVDVSKSGYESGYGEGVVSVTI